MRYDWGEAKRLSNIEKHGVDFVVAEGFEWDAAFIRASHTSNEPRLDPIGPIGSRLHALAYSIEPRIVPIISLRQANNREVWPYGSPD